MAQKTAQKESFILILLALELSYTESVNE